MLSDSSFSNARSHKKDYKAKFIDLYLKQINVHKKYMEAENGIEPMYTELQSAA